MTGATRLTGGEPRKASQKRSRRAGPPPTHMMPQWRMGDRVRWQDKTGVFHRDLGDPDDREKAEGKADEVAGKVQDAVGRGTRKVGKAIEDIGKAVKRG